MSPAESNSMDAFLSPVLNSFHTVPPAAIPPMLDCILASSGASPALLYDFLISNFSDHIKRIVEDNDKLGLEECNFLVAYLRSLSHLLKNSGVSCIGFRSFVSKAFVPLMKMGHMYGRETLTEIQESLFELFTINNNWEVIEDTLVPFLLRSVATSMDLHPIDDTTIIKWSKYLVSSDLESTVLPLSISCHILSSLLGASMHADQAVRSTSADSFAGEYCTEKLCWTLLSDLCDMTIRMLLHSSEHRSCAVGLLFPTVLDAFASKCSFKIPVHGDACGISRNYFYMKTWECCRTLFSLGPVERRDAYGIMSLYLSYLPCVDGSEVEVVHRAEEFTIITEKEFWDEIKRGLVDKEGLVRKQSLHILKKTMLMNEDSKSSPSFLDKGSCEKNSIPSGMKKRDMWADKEAQSLGVGQVCRSFDPSFGKLEKWQAFLLLYEMLDEYGTHLVEAAWNHQIALLLSPSCQEDESSDLIGVGGKQLENPYMNFCWLAILWERGLFHDNPHVRCLIMQSFLDIEWKKQGNTANLFPESFLLGPFIEGLNDPVHHKDFGLKGFYSSKTIEGASRFLHHYCSFFDERKLISFLCKLASVGRHQSLGRAGLMAVAECISSASLSSTIYMAPNLNHRSCEVNCNVDAMLDVKKMESLDTELCTEKTILIDNLRFLMESSKQHFNANYRLRVCEKALQAAVSVVSTHELPFEMLLLFVAALPREFTDDGGSLRSKVHEWLTGCGSHHDKMHLLQNLLEFPYRFSSHGHAVDSSVQYDDEDLFSWEVKSERWARVLFLQIEEEQQLEPLFTFLKDKGAILQQKELVGSIPVKILILILSLVRELEIVQRKAEQGLVLRTEIVPGLCELLKGEKHGQMSDIARKFANIFFVILKDLTSFAASSCSIFWSDMVVGSMHLPGAVTGRLGGPSQRRLSSSITTAVLQAITSMRTVACLSSWFLHARMTADLNGPITFLWEFFWKVVSPSLCESEASSEIYVAAYEALSSILKALVPVFSSSVINIILKTSSTPDKNSNSDPILNSLVFSFLKHINSLLSSGLLARARIAILLNWKWSCLESLLSIPYNAHQNRVQPNCSITFYSRDAIKFIFNDLVESLENAGENSVLPMLRSVRFVLDMLTTGGSFVSEHDGVDVQMMWQLVHSSWILHTSCNKRRVAPIAALLSSILHASVFSDESMHVIDDVAGPLKWFCGKVLEEGTKSPRTIRLAALHLTGLWLSNPRTIKYYLKELKLLTLYGSVAFDEDFESELTENGDARSEVALLAKSPDPEMTEVFINTELYGRVSVAVLFYKLAEMKSRNHSDDSFAALESGKLFLLELLDSAVNDNDLAKELYKKYSAIHRRKVRVWQMICVLSRFVDQGIVHQVAEKLHLAIYRNNMPSVRQYMETFAINLYLKFPHLVSGHIWFEAMDVGQQLVPILRKYDMRTQALSSYVFVAANLVLHANEAVQSELLEALLPPLVPLLTSHHHTLRGFTQLLVHKVLSKDFPSVGEGCFASSCLEKKCFLDLKSYLSLNPDCLRLRSSMERFLDTFSPEHSITPSGIFSNRIEAMEFECVPISLMELVVNFLNDARNELRHAMANDEVTIKNENLKMSVPSSYTDDQSINEKNQESLACQPTDVSVDFQKKFTLLKHEMENDRSASFLDRLEIYKPLAELEKEDRLLVQMMQSRFTSMERLNTSRQELILVASLIDRIPNLAGLARTCEVFKATSLAIADTSVLHDRQFQLISVTAEKWIPIIEVPVNSVTTFLEKKKREGFSVLGLEQTANSVPLDKFEFPKRTVLVLGREKEGIPVDIIHILDACIEIPQLGVVRSLNVHVSGAIAIWEQPPYPNPIIQSHTLQEGEKIV
ncbi:hypothetical protein V2J09_009956 [Rumex salicifolius]